VGECGREWPENGLAVRMPCNPVTLCRNLRIGRAFRDFTVTFALLLSIQRTRSIACFCISSTETAQQWMLIRRQRLSRPRSSKSGLSILTDVRPPSLESPSLVGKNAIVTGASRGIGSQVARELAARGANIAICFVSQQSKIIAEALAIELRAMGVVTTCVQEDLAVPGAGARVVEKALAGLNTNTVHILVNNAALDPPEPMPVHQTPAHLFDRYGSGSGSGFPPRSVPVPAW